MARLFEHAGKLAACGRCSSVTLGRSHRAPQPVGSTYPLAPGILPSLTNGRDREIGVRDRTRSGVPRNAVCARSFLLLDERKSEPRSSTKSMYAGATVCARVARTCEGTLE